MEEKNLNVAEEVNEEVKEELFEDVEEAVTAGWTGCASCCS